LKHISKLKTMIVMKNTGKSEFSLEECTEKRGNNREITY
jgi:hypothetical protein